MIPSTNPGSSGMLGTHLGAVTLPGLISACRSALVHREENHPYVVSCANPHSLVVARKDTEFRLALNASSALLVDGIGCVIASRILGSRIGPRVTGYDAYVAIMRELDSRGGCAFFFGSTSEVLNSISKRAKNDFPRVRVHTLSPSFGHWNDDLNRHYVSEINLVRPDVLWVGLTAPKQEKWVMTHRSALRVPIIANVGAVFDYYGGRVRLAPSAIRMCGLEWLYRLAQEPRRLWRRTFVSAPYFLLLVLAERLALLRDKHSKGY